VSVGKNIWYTSISTLIPSTFAYLFWFVTAKMYGAETIGVASTIASLVIIIATINVLDMHLGMKRSLGIAISSGDIGRFKQILTSTVVFVSIIVIISMVLIVIPNLKILEMLRIDRQYTWILIAMILAQAFQYIFIEALISALRSKNLVMPLLLGSLSRFPILFGVAYLFNTSTMETIIAFSSTVFISTAFFAIYSIKIFRGSQVRATENLCSNIMHILRVSVSSWIPNILYIFGYLFGIITVFSVVGAAEGGKLYIVMGTFIIILFIVNSINKVTHSLVAGLNNNEQQTTYLSYSMKVAFIFTMPLAMPLLFFANNFLGIVNKEFSSAASAMSIFMISLPMVIISEMVYYFVYGRGDQKSVLFLGLTGNIPRVVLYFFLSPILGINGAALAFLVGSVTQFVLSVKVGNKHSISMQFRKYIILTTIPLTIGFLTWLVNINFVISTIIIFIGSFLLYIRLHMFTDTELHNLIYAGLPASQANKVYPIASKVMQKIK
jgi:O-antigen/teichoic acid export membrane protein